MGKTVDQLTSEELKVYRMAAKQRRMLEEKTLDDRKQLAWNVAREAADFLRAHYGVTRVALFGSLLDGRRFTKYSDVDLAVWGLSPEQWLSATGDLWHLGLSRGIPIHLVDVDMCYKTLLHSIYDEGVDV